LSPDDVYLTNGCAQAIEIVVSILARPGANILLPRPGYQFYAARAAYNGVEVRYFNLLPESKWEVDLDGLEALADENTVAMVIVNPGNPYEVYEHLTFGSNPFVPMGMFGEVVPVLTLGSISKRWVVPGWRLGWIVTNDPNGIVECLKNYLDISCDPTTFVQVRRFKLSYFRVVPKCRLTQLHVCDGKASIVFLLSEAYATCYLSNERIVPQVKLDLSRLEDIHDDMDFCSKLAKEELVIVLPGEQPSVGLESSSSCW
ncbi:hypothetical protein BHM03_00062295, partial [Ensete ventricosum]